MAANGSGGLLGLDLERQKSHIEMDRSRDGMLESVAS